MYKPKCTCTLVKLHAELYTCIGEFTHLTSDVILSNLHIIKWRIGWQINN